MSGKPPMGNDWRQRFEVMFSKMELFGVKAANKMA